MGKWQVVVLGLCALLTGCGAPPSQTVATQNYAAEQRQKAEVGPALLTIHQKYIAAHPRLILRGFGSVILVAGEVATAEDQRRIFDEVSAIPSAEVYTFTLVRQVSTPERLAKDEALRAKVAALIPSSYGLEVYVVDGRLGVVGRLLTENYEPLRDILTGIERKVPGVEADPYLVLVMQGSLSLMTAEQALDMGDWVPAGTKSLPPIRPTNLSGTVTTTAIKPAIAYASTPSPVSPPSTAPTPSAVSAPAPSSYSEPAPARDERGGMGALGSLLQASGQIAQAAGGQSYESGLLMAGIGAAMAGDGAAAQQAVSSSQQYQAQQQVQRLQQQQQLAAQLARAEQARGTVAASYALPKIDPTCVTFEDIKGLTAYIRNGCSVPVKVTWCWVPQGASNCTADSSSSVIAVGSRRMVHGPDRNNRYASFVVCDASEGDKACLVER